MNQSVQRAIQNLLAQRSLSADESQQAFWALMAGSVEAAEAGAFLALLAARTPTSEELLGAARVMREHVERVPTTLDPDSLVDTCGTGGAPKTFNVSTTAAIIAAAAGVHVAKHGNRSRTGRGSAELLEALGVRVDAGRSTQAACLERVGICFCFAVHHHPAMAALSPVRKALGFPTLFNLLGPLTNPVGAKRQVLGVYDARLMMPLAETLRALGATRAIVLHSVDGLDELSISAPTELIHVAGGELRRERIAPEDVDLPRAPREAVVARDLTHSVQIVRSVIDGSERGAPRDMSLLSAAAALLVAGRVHDWADGVRVARHMIDERHAQRTLERWIGCSHDGRAAT